MLFGVDAATDAVDLAQAVMEGVAFSLAEAQDCLAAAGTEVAALAGIGGGARSPFWMQLLATVLGRPVTLYAGAARLARLALTGEAPTTICRKPEIAAVLEPQRALVLAYREQAVRFRHLYHVLRPQFPDRLVPARPVRNGQRAGK